MIPCRILVIAPYESMKNILLLICKDRPEVRLTVMVGDLGEGARLVQEIDEEEFDIVISRGGTAEVLRSVVSIPVVEIQLSSYDVLSALKLAENYTGRYALVAYPNIARMATLLCSVLQYDVPIYPIAQGDTLEKTVDELIQRDVTLIIGDMVTTQYARQHSLDAILITSGVESLENSIRQALQLHQLMTAVRVRDALLERQARQHQWELAVLQEDQTVFWESPSLARKPRLRKMMQKIAAHADAAEGGVQMEDFLSASISGGFPLFLSAGRASAGGHDPQRGRELFQLRRYFAAVFQEIHQLRPSPKSAALCGFPFSCADPWRDQHTQGPGRQRSIYQRAAS